MKRVWDHKNNHVTGFTEKYNIHNLVYYELHESMESAIIREKQIKKWNCSWKIRLIEEMNPEWDGLYDNMI